jgi:hypothetical protein
LSCKAQHDREHKHDKENGYREIVIPAASADREEKPEEPLRRVFTTTEEALLQSW